MFLFCYVYVLLWIFPMSKKGINNSYTPTFSKIFSEIHVPGRLYKIFLGNEVRGPFVFEPLYCNSFHDQKFGNLS